MAAAVSATTVATPHMPHPTASKAARVDAAEASHVAPVTSQVRRGTAEPTIPTMMDRRREAASVASQSATIATQSVNRRVSTACVMCREPARSPAEVLDWSQSVRAIQARGVGDGGPVPARRGVQMAQAATNPRHSVMMRSACTRVDKLPPP